MIIFIDNYDSFTYNLVQYIGERRSDIRVFRNDAVSVEDIGEMKPDGIIISPGPCTPDEAGISVETVKKLGPTFPILGVCLGHQSIGQAFGGNVIRAPEIMHGKVSEIFHDSRTIFKGLDNPFRATRYHSLIVEKDSCPDCLEISAYTENGLIMGVRHKEYNIEGIQFHPESILTEPGKKLLNNFLDSL